MKPGDTRRTQARKSSSPCASRFHILTMSLLETSLEELQSCYEEIRLQWEENQLEYEARYGDAPANYGASISDDLNGDGEEFTRLTLIFQQVGEEIQRRFHTPKEYLKPERLISTQLFL